jgi:hypothetical protein
MATSSIMYRMYGMSRAQDAQERLAQIARSRILHPTREGREGLVTNSSSINKQ